MIDIYAPRGTFADPHGLVCDAAATVMAVEQVPDIPMFRQNAVAFVHELDPSCLSDVDGANDDIRVQVPLESAVSSGGGSSPVDLELPGRRVDHRRDLSP